MPKHTRIPVASNEVGNIHLCPSCNCFEMLFGNVHLKLSPEWLTSLVNHLEQVNPAETGQALMLATHNPNMEIVVQPEHYHPLMELLRAARHMAQLTSLYEELGITYPVAE